MVKRISFIFSLALPAIVENILQFIVGFVDTLFVSKLGLSSVAAVGLIQILLNIYFVLFLAIGTVSTVMVAQYFGANQIQKARSVAKQSILLACLIGLFVGVISLFLAEPILKAMGAEADILKDGVIYFRIVAVPSIIISLMFVYSGLLRGIGDTVSPMKAGFWMNVIHIPLDYLLIFGLGPIPGLGITGAAIATVLARLAGLFILISYFKKSPSKIGMDLPHKWFNDWQTLRAIIRMGTPIAFERLFMRLGQVIYYSLILSLGTTTFAAHQIAGNLESFSFVIGTGFTVAVTTLVAQSYGARQIREAFIYSNYSVLLAVCLMSTFSFFLFFAGSWGAQHFTDNREVIELVDMVLKIHACSLIFQAINLVLTGTLNGLGDTKWPLISTAIGTWFVRLVAAYGLGILLNWGLIGVWIGIFLDDLWRALFLFGRFHYLKKRYQKKAETHSLSLS
ncbi:MATE family efflux transporter [Ammoniphilus sp. YIM 78166]|uniref:MATE family efflux transporter n=1 Tax=Ammoniphilus sp. YIM 78166 TaxID=1644106 RepID=UPI001F1089C4|nr:MATE family efflux transporter [Ammoniphilus sp. YIM 78166]